MGLTAWRPLPPAAAHTPPHAPQPPGPWHTGHLEARAQQGRLGRGRGSRSDRLGLGPLCGAGTGWPLTARLSGVWTASFPGADLRCLGLGGSSTEKGCWLQASLSLLPCAHPPQTVRPGTEALEAWETQFSPSRLGPGSTRRWCVSLGPGPERLPAGRGAGSGPVCRGKRRREREEGEGEEGEGPWGQRQRGPQPGAVPVTRPATPHPTPQPPTRLLRRFPQPCSPPRPTPALPGGFCG